MLSRLLKLRKRIKRKKPDYLRPYYWMKIRIRNKMDSWRRPKGKHNKIKIRKKGKPARVETGYGSPKKVKGLLPNGKRPVVIHNIRELERINPEIETPIIASTVGRKKRIEILLRAKELGINLWNIKNIDEALKQLEYNTKEVQEIKA